MGSHASEDNARASCKTREETNTSTAILPVCPRLEREAMAALRLVEEGKLSFESDVNPALTSWKIPPYSHSMVPGGFEVTS
jgi:hypothetical protein